MPGYFNIASFMLFAPVLAIFSPFFAFASKSAFFTNKIIFIVSDFFLYHILIQRIYRIFLTGFSIFIRYSETPFFRSMGWSLPSL